MLHHHTAAKISFKRIHRLVPWFNKHLAHLNHHRQLPLKAQHRRRCILHRHCATRRFRNIPVSIDCIVADAILARHHHVHRVVHAHQLRHVPIEPIQRRRSRIHVRRAGLHHNLRLANELDHRRYLVTTHLNRSSLPRRLVARLVLDGVYQLIDAHLACIHLTKYLHQCTQVPIHKVVRLVTRFTEQLPLRNLVIRATQ